MKKMLITGATGFLGRHAVEFFSKEYQVVAFGRNQSIGNELVKLPNVTFVSGNLKNRDDIQKAGNKCNYIVHCGALSAPFGKRKDFEDANVIGTKNLVDYAMENDVERLIHVSTPSIYFNHTTKLDVNENEPLPATFPSLYTETKHKAELIVADAVNKGLPAILIRPRALFGPFDKTLVPRLLRANVKAFIPLINDGAVLTDITYVENVVHSIVCALKADAKFSGEVYNITNGEPKTIKEILDSLFHKLNMKPNYKRVPKPIFLGLARLMDLIGNVTGKEPPFTSYSASLLCFSQTLSIDKARNELGYEPIFTIDEGVEKYVTWYKNQI